MKTKKHAYLIMAHHKFLQLQILVSLLDDERNDIYIHMDKKAKVDDYELERIKNSAKYSNVYIIPRRDIYWGGYSLVLVEISLFGNARNNNTYEYYHLISGDDLPLQSQDYIHNFFDANKGKVFLTMVSDELFKRNNIENRVKYYYYFSKYNNRTINNKILNKLISVYRKVEKVIQKIIKVNRVKNSKIKYASNWLSLDLETVDLVLKEKKWIEKTFKHTIISDELFIPTLLYKYNKEGKIYHKEGINDKPTEFQGNLRYINWWDGAPYTWSDSKKDIEQLELGRQLGHLFSRKFDLEQYPEMKNIILKFNEKI